MRVVVVSNKDQDNVEGQTGTENPLSGDKNELAS